VLLSGGKVDSLGVEGCTAGREINGLLGGGGLCCWVGILVGRGPCCSAGDGSATRRESALLLGAIVVDCYYVGRAVLLGG